MNKSHSPEDLAGLTPEQRRQLLKQLLLQRADDSNPSGLLSYGQRALWFMHQLAPASSAYNWVFQGIVCSPVDVDALRGALQLLLDRHAQLRSTFHAQSGEPVQKIHEHRDIHFETIDARSWSQQRLDRCVDEESRRPFDLEQGPIFRVSLFTRSEREHVFLSVAHHIVMDARSLEILMRDLGCLYSASSGSPVQLPRVRPYAEYVQWQREMLEGSAGEKLEAYWREQLASELPVLDVPTDHARPAVPQLRGGVHRFSLPEDVSRALCSLAKSEGTTPFVVMMAAYQVLLWRYSGQEDILVGTPVAGRTQADFEDVVGYFVNPVVIRGKPSSEQAFKTFLHRVRQTVLAALSHQDYPFARTVERLQPRRDPSRSPIFQTMFSWHNLQWSREPTDDADPSERRIAHLGELDIVAVELPQQEGQFELALDIFDSGGAFSGALKYDVALFEPSTIARMAGQFQTLLEGIADDPECALSELPFLSDAERRQILNEWNDTSREYSHEKCLHALFETEAERRPDSVAVVFEDEQLTYGELNTRADALARYLRQRGAGPEELIGICVHPSIEMVVGLLAVLKAGSAYLPLDPSYPPDRLRFIISDAQVKLILTQQDVAASVPVHGGEVVRLDSDWDRIAGAAGGERCPEVTAGNLAYVIYTSGSTGKPKGVEVPHRAVVNFLSSMRESPGLNEDDVLLSVTTLSFDISILEIFLPLSVGAQLVLSDRSASTDGKQLAQQLTEHQVSAMQATPTTWRLLLAAGWAGRSELKALCGGEAWPRELADALLERCDSLWNMYGPTETTVWSSAHPLGGDSKTIPIGHPIANTELYVLDRHMQPVPVGVPGELYIGGAGLARGYRNRPELTCESFPPHPLDGGSGSRLYRTGDVARYRADGTAEFLGRSDDQVKLRGFRIELGEIETRLAEHEGVRRAAAMVREDVPSDQRLVAYVISETEERPSATELRGFLSRSLPGHMVPTGWVFLKAFPLTPNGKLDRKALPLPAVPEESDHPDSARVALNALESQIAEVWKEVLQIEIVGLRDNFFELGGHSLLLARAAARLSERLERDLTVVDLFQYPTIESLAQRLGSLDEQEPTHEAARALIRSPAGALSYGQRALWFMHQLAPESSAYNWAFRGIVCSHVDVDALRSALQSLWDRHAQLRSTFTMRSREPFQQVHEHRDVHFEANDARSWSPDRLDRSVEEEARRPFDLEKGPVLRVSLFTRSEREHILLIVVHHIVMDARSLEICLNDLGRLYSASRAGITAQLPPAPSYAEYVHWQREMLASPAGERLEAYWRNQLASDLPALGGLPVLDVPTDHPRPSVAQLRGDFHEFTLTEDVGRALYGLAKREGTTPFVVMMAAYQVLLWRESGQEDILVGTPVEARTKAAFEDVVGYFVNPVVIRGRPSSDQTFETFVHRVRETVRDALSHQDYPFALMVERLQPRRDLSRSPIFQTMFSWHSVAWSHERTGGVGPRENRWIGQLGDLDVTAVGLPQQEGQFDLALDVFETGGVFSGALKYDVALFEPSTIAGMADHFQRLLEEVAADPERRLSDLPHSSEPERHHITPSGRLDRKALPISAAAAAPASQPSQAAPEESGHPGSPPVAPNAVEKQIAEVWKEVLRVETVGLRDNFFDLGGHSLLLAGVAATLNERLGYDLAVVDLFQYPTIESLARHLSGLGDERLFHEGARARARRSVDADDRAIAVVGMAARLPGAGNIHEFWSNLDRGVESVTFFSEPELRQAGVDEELLRNPRYVKARAILEDADLFDASFFGYTPKEAELLDPQHRLFLECAREALEDAAYDPERYRGLIGVYAGAAMNTYLLGRPVSDLVKSVGGTQLMIGNEKDFVPTRVSYKLGLRGPSVSVQTACSTSLTAVHLACRSLGSHECDLALAGGVAVSWPVTKGHLYQEGGIASPDGHCRAFDADAQGTVFGDGVGVVVLKRLSEALADGDAVHAVIRGSAVNNDGSAKVGYTAPSLEGQSEVIALAHADAQVDPRTISYVECQGTATELGDPIEVKALTRVMRERTADEGFCALGSVKTNIGHLDAASGIAGLIKTILALEHRRIPPSLHFEEPNPGLELSSSPFYVSTTSTDWAPGSSPRRAGVSSFGIGGTNCHMILEEAPQRPPSSPSRPWQLLTFSAKTAGALEASTERVLDHLRSHPETNLADAAYTLQVGRQALPYRRTILCESLDDAIDVLARRDSGAMMSSKANDSGPAPLFIFPGEGSQYVRMGAGIYEAEPTFRRWVDLCSERLSSELECDLRDLLFPGVAHEREAEQQLLQTRFTQPALFVVTYALARLWMEWGIHPQAMIGHGVSEYVAACLAEVFSLEDALGLVATRGSLMQASSLDAVVEPFARAVSKVHRSTPKIPFLSNVTGTWIRDGEATDASYWARNLRDAAHLVESVSEMLKEPDRVFLEIGPGQALSLLATQHTGRSSGHLVVSSLRQTEDVRTDSASLLSSLGRLWLSGVQVDWSGFYRSERRHRIGLPVYPFERKRYSLETGRERATDEAAAEGRLQNQKPGVAHWLGLVHRQFAKWVLPRAEEKSLRHASTTIASNGDGETGAGPSAASAASSQQLVTELWKELLGVDEIDIGDNFFDLGGTSLMALQVSERIERATGVHLPFSAFLGNSLGQVARKFEKALDEKQSAAAAREQAQRRSVVHRIKAGLLGLKES